MIRLWDFRATGLTLRGREGGLDRGGTRSRQNPQYEAVIGEG